jgi:hypothetical protein
VAQFTPMLTVYLFDFFLGYVCVPIDANNCDDFDPKAVPTLSLVCSTEATVTEN